MGAQVSAAERQRAKGLCYGILYGAGPACLAVQVNRPYGESLMQL